MTKLYSKTTMKQIKTKSSGGPHPFVVSKVPTDEVDQSETTRSSRHVPCCMSVCLFNLFFQRCDADNQLCALDDDSKKLGFYGVQSGMEVTNSLPPLNACMCHSDGVSMQRCVLRVVRVWRLAVRFFATQKSRELYWVCPALQLSASASVKSGVSRLSQYQCGSSGTSSLSRVSILWMPTSSD